MPALFTHLHRRAGGVLLVGQIPQFSRFSTKDFPASAVSILSFVLILFLSPYTATMSFLFAVITAVLFSSTVAAVLATVATVLFSSAVAAVDLTGYVLPSVCPTLSASKF